MTQPARRPRRPAAPPPRPHPSSSRGQARLSPGLAWLAHHAYVLLFSLGQLSRAPLPSLMTAAVIGIALALPTGLYLLLENVRHVSAGWDGSMQLSVYLHRDIEAEQIEILRSSLEQREDVASIQLITPQQALEEYRRLSGFKDALDALEENPLPSVLVIQPRLNDAQSGDALAADLRELPEVAAAQFDMEWLKRLFAIMDTVQRGVWVLAALLGLAVLLIIGNTIRLAINNRREEIEINKLFGATDAFIRRPFLYSGLWYGLWGALLGWALVELIFYALDRPTRELALLYHSDYHLIGLAASEALLLLLGGALLGLCGAWLAVGRHLRDIQPH